jgi:glyoxylase-like metal-dependent hydrolase (beta-lactamase superfamily II)
LARPDVICLTNGVFAENCYILADRTAGDAVLVDPGEEAELFLARLRTERLTLRAIWLTHAHLDHVLGIPVVREHSSAPIWLHPDDRPLYDAAPQQARALLGAELPPLPAPDRAFVPGDPVSVGACDFEVRHVPGHSPGGVALVGDGIALVGDALFAGSIGRTDLPGGDLGTLLTSIGRELLTLPDDMIVLAGHGPATTIGRERVTNPFLSGEVEVG